MERTIRVTGKGKISVTPDRIRLLIKQTNVLNTYENAIKDSSESKGFLNEAFCKLGFKKEDLKTTYFNIDTKYERYRDKHDNWREKFLGYEYVHRMKIEFEKDNELLGKVLGVMAKCAGEPEFTIQFTVSDPEASKNELLAKAVEDSRAKADVLSRATGVGLGEILSIDYSWGELEIYSRPLENVKYWKCEADELDSIGLDIEADDIDITDTVTVLWSIK
ncbi:MAG: SIMPL domain-containing protein [Lachnospiraceae bacterium]|nr:SIMPL domain-containing protein [Lachnospiraceae bacterium]